MVEKFIFTPLPTKIEKITQLFIISKNTFLIGSGSGLFKLELLPDLTFDKNFDEHFIQGMGRRKSTWFSYHEKWFANEEKLPILYISYEQLKTDMDNTLKRIADFLKVPLTDEVIGRIKTNASFEYMKANESKFGVKQPKEPRLVFDNFISSHAGISHLNFFCREAHVIILDYLTKLSQFFFDH